MGGISVSGAARWFTAVGAIFWLSCGGDIPAEGDVDFTADQAGTYRCDYDAPVACDEVTYFNAGSPAADGCCRRYRQGPANDFTWAPRGPAPGGGCRIAVATTCYPPN